MNNKIEIIGRMQTIINNIMNDENYKPNHLELVKVLSAAIDAINNA